ncbi:hypothetical protein AMELA_G00240340 [Ameiurus melas]|uniref:snRNA-activating protein complex subunit 4 n=1 Tax=Ameiurus melas TaxID=219545 RepID=A0A7J5ZV92_AMEME|nr:hypothetical protein AMELA_G00240340 [Ameiurus melas]
MRELINTLKEAKWHYLLSSDSDSGDESDDSGHAGEDVAHTDLQAERQQIQREIEELERKLGADAALVDALTDSENGSLSDPSGEDSDEDLDLPQDLETCLQMNLVYQEVLKEKLADLERLLNENREQQKELEEQVSGPAYINPGLPHLKLFLGSFMKPYFKDKLTGLGPPANEETKERLSHGTKPCDEMKIRRWEPWQKTLLMSSVAADAMKRMLQPKLSKMEYLTTKMCKAEGGEKEELQKQIALLEKDITEIRSMKDDQLYGDRHDDHDWDKISNIDFEGIRQPDDLMRFWQNYLHPTINKSTWNQDEIAKLAEIAQEHMYRDWEQIAESLGNGRTAFMCFQIYQRYISKQFRKREWTEEEDRVFRELVDKMRIGNFIPYTQISYFIEGRDSSQLNYRWTCVLDPSIKKGPWTKEEDQLLLNAVKKYGCKEWWKIRQEVPGRTDNYCRDRYLDCLRTDVKKGAWSDEEVELLKKLVEKYGVGKWAKIASEIPNRLDSQCLNKWRYMMHMAHKESVKRERSSKRVKLEPQLKRRRVRQGKRRKLKDYNFKTESDTSEDEKERVPYMDSDGENKVENEVENVSSTEDCRLEYVQPDMKEWIPAHGNKLVYSPGNLKTILVRVPTEAEEGAGDRVRNTVLDNLGNPVKTYVSMEPTALHELNSSDEHAMIMASECDVKRFLNWKRAYVLKVRARKTKTSLSSSTNQNDGKNDEEEDKSETESDLRKCKPVHKRVPITKLSYDLMLAITPWIGNQNIPLLKSPVFLLFLQALKVDADGCKKVIEARKDKASSTTGSESKPYPAKKPTPCSYYHVKTVSDILAERTAQKKHSRPLQSPEFLEPQLLPQLAKIAQRPQQQSKTKPVMQSASQEIKSTMILPQTFVVAQSNTDNKVGTSHNVVQGILPLQQLGTQEASKSPQSVQHLAVPEESERVTEPASCPTTSVSTTGPLTETLEGVHAPKRKHKPTMKAQALMDNASAKKQVRNRKLKKQAAKKQQNTATTKNNITQTVAVPPNTTAWILTPAGLMPVAGIQVQSPDIPGNQSQVMPNKVQMLFHPPVIVNQSSCVALNNAVMPISPKPDLPGNNNISLTAGSNLGQNPRPSSVSDKSIDSSLHSSHVLPETNVPTSIIGSINPMSSAVPVSSSPMGTNKNRTPSCMSDATDNVPNVSSASAVTSTPSIPSVHPLNISGPGTIPGSQSQRMPHPVSQVLFQHPIIVNQNGSLALINPTGPCLITNAPPTASANVTMVPTNSTAPNVNNNLPTSSNEGSMALNVAGPCLNTNSPPTATANVTRVPPNSAALNINKSHPTSTEGCTISSAYSVISNSAPYSALNETSHATPQFGFMNSPVTVGVLPTNQLCVNTPISSMTTSQILPQTVAEQKAPQARQKTVRRTATTSNPRPQKITFDPSLMFLEQPAQVKNWLKGNDGISLPGLKDKLPYLPPFVTSTITLTTLLKGRDSLLKSAVQLLPEEHKDNTEEEAKIAAVRKMVSERFKTNQAYLLLKARFLSCFTLPALLATINPCTELTDALDPEDSMGKVKPKQFGDEDQLEPSGSLLKESELTATQFPGNKPRDQTDGHKNA